VSTPAVEIRSFAVAIPAGTLITAPLVTPVYFPARKVQAINWRIPAGPSGLMGWKLTSSGGQAVIPAGGGWIVTDDDAGVWALYGQPDTGYWEVTGYNSDIYPHTVYLDFLLDVISGAQTTVPMASNAALSSQS